ncbi:cinnamoyl-CoA reductase 2-like protein [Tanacetum coccineum]
MRYMVELIEPAVKGTLNVLKACCEVIVKKVVYVSSVTALCMVPNRPDRPLDETFWSDQEFCRTNNDWYCLSKTQAESEAWEFSERNGIDLKLIEPKGVFSATSEKLQELGWIYRPLEETLVDALGRDPPQLGASGEDPKAAKATAQMNVKHCGFSVRNSLVYTLKLSGCSFWFIENDICGHCEYGTTNSLCFLKQEMSNNEMLLAIHLADATVELAVAGIDQCRCRKVYLS